MTIEEKIRHYEYVLDSMNYGTIYICIALKQSYNQGKQFDDRVYELRKIHQLFPELMNHKPKDVHDPIGGAWWSPLDKESRIKVLTEIINDLKKQL